MFPGSARRSGFAMFACILVATRPLTEHNDTPMSHTVSTTAQSGAKKAKKRRLDQLMVERGLATGRDRARALVMAREVLVDGQVAHRPAAPVASDVLIEVKTPPRFVSRGG